MFYLPGLCVGGECTGVLQSLGIASRLSSVLSEEILGSLWKDPCWLIVFAYTYHLNKYDITNINQTTSWHLILIIKHSNCGFTSLPGKCEQN